MCAPSCRNDEASLRRVGGVGRGRQSYCHNHKLIVSKGQEKTEREIAEELRRNYLIDSVCITGGEPAMQDITELVKELNFLDVKLDTNGYYSGRKLQDS